MRSETKTLSTVLDDLCTPLKAMGVVEPIGAIPKDPEKHLTLWEQAIWSTLRNEKRKREWYAGRMAAKKAVRQHLQLSEEKSVEIGKEESGAPVLSQFKECTVTISHSDEFAVAVASNRSVGIDLERIEDRPNSLINYYFSEAEQQFMAKIRDDQALHCNLIWTGKEAVSKLMRLGGALDFKAIDTRLNPIMVEGKETSISCFSKWTENYMVTIAVDKEESHG